MQNGIAKVINGYMEELRRKQRVIALLVDRVRMLSGERDRLSKKVIELSAEIRLLKAH